jgi:hypothetical protein
MRLVSGGHSVLSLFSSPSLRLPSLLWQMAASDKTFAFIARSVVLFFACVRLPTPKNKKTDRAKKTKSAFYIALHHLRLSY